MARPMVTRDPEVLGRAPVIAGTRLYATTVAEYLDSGSTLDDVRHAFPTIPDAWLDTLATFPLPPYTPAPEVDQVCLDHRDAQIAVYEVWWRPDDIPALCDALKAAAEASRQWQRDVDAWIAAHMLEEDDDAVDG